MAPEQHAGTEGLNPLTQLEVTADMLLVGAFVGAMVGLKEDQILGA
jgi:hypothetical protein